MADESLSAVAVADPSPAPRAERGPVDAVAYQLENFLAEQRAQLTRLDPALAPLLRTAVDAVLAGGKRMRPTFAHWGWRAAAGPQAPLSHVVPALAALELMHAFALVHDDIMDASLTRRGRPTAHVALAGTHRGQGMRGDSGHFGVSAAILAGDLCLVWADQLMSRAFVPPGVLRRARAGYDRMRVETIAGQFLDVLGGSAPQWTVQRALRTAELKTAGYTVTRPLLFGVTLADRADPALDAAFTRYGNAVGVAFQLRDDLLGLYGSPERLGKPVGDDVLSGQPTVLLELARALAAPAQAAELERLIRQRAGLARIGELVAETGATRRLDQMIARRVEVALDTLDRAPMDPCAREPLARLAGEAAWRQR